MTLVAIRRDRTQSGWALLTVMPLWLLLLGGCSVPWEGRPSAAPSPSESLSIPVGALPPHIQCLVDAGFRVSVEPPQFEGDPPSYQAESDLPREAMMEAIDRCQELAPSRAPLSDAEVRVIYDRWVKERECLVGLGYHPVEPPTFEKFLADWNSTGPWMPIDGIDTNAWSGADYEAAKKACTLEFFSRS